MEVSQLKRPMHPLKVIEEWRNGCSCSIGAEGEAVHPSTCEACTEAAMEAIESWFKSSSEPEWGDWKLVP